jgi:HK97 family phage major capsid protein
LELLQDSAIDVNATVMNMLGVRLGRAANTYLTIGTGTSQPKGVLTAATLGKAGLTGQTTTVIYADLVDLLFSVDKAYRDNPGARFMMNDSTFKAILKMVDSQNRPLILPYGAPLAGNIPVALFGKDITINNDVPAMGVSAKSILYGDFSKYMIRQLMQINIQRLVERYAEFGQVGFIGLMRLDGQLLDAGTHPICYYQNSAT